MTTNLKRLGLALAVALVMPEWRAHADLTWDFSFSESDGTNTFGASGILTTTSTPTGGPYTVTGISGTWTANTTTGTISDLITPSGFFSNDNLLSRTQPFVDEGGLAFSIPSTMIEGHTIDAVLVFSFNEGPAGSIQQVDLGTTPRNLSLQFADDPTFQLTPAAAVPEPSTTILAVFGAVDFIAYGWTRLRREERRQAAA